ncbi:MAG: preprotein translocase subunit YajC [Victivallaceae bacterium]|nr:preprotein translocase subunit YajC [Victivallaceae bacterium]
MLEFIIAEGAAQGQQGVGSGLIQMAPIFIILIVFMFFMTRSQKKQQQKRQQMLDQLVKGTPVMLGSGIYGTIVEVLENDFRVEIAPAVVVKVAKNGVAEPGQAPAAEGAKK